MFKLEFSMGRKQLYAKGITTCEVNNDHLSANLRESVDGLSKWGVTDLCMGINFFESVYEYIFYITGENTAVYHEYNQW